MSGRRLYIDSGPGETRGVITLDGRPERLLIERDGQDWPRLGARYRARVVKLDKGSGLALLDLSLGVEAALRLKADRAPPTEGQALEIEISIEPQAEKLAVARVLGETQGAPGLLAGAMTLEARLKALAPEADVTRGAKARAMADEAEDEALAVEHALPGGGSMTVETTRALTAVDIDLGAAGAKDPKRASRQANFNAIAALAPLLRLKALGGLVVIDLIGRGHDGTALARAVQAAFAPDQPGVILGPITKFGTLELALPRRHRPLRDILCSAAGGLSAQSLALRMLRAVEREASADPGGRFIVSCSPAVAKAATGPAGALAGTIGARFEVSSDPAVADGRFEIHPR